MISQDNIRDRNSTDRIYFVVGILRRYILVTCTRVRVLHIYNGPKRLLTGICIVARIDRLREVHWDN